MGKRRGVPAKRALLPLLLLAGSTLALPGCVASMAAGAVGAAVQAATPKRADVTEDRRAAASTACQARASAEGRVHIIDAEQRRDGRVTVWGTIEKEGARRAFECRYDGKVSAFKLRAINPR